MVVLSAEQVRAWDNYTMEHSPISSIDLMERAAAACVDWLEEKGLVEQQQFYIFCGKGNNGGDGLAMARMLEAKGRPVDVFIPEFGHLGTQDFQLNLQRLHQTNVPIHFIQPGNPLPDLPSGIIIIDALLGTGLNRPLEGFLLELVEHINESKNAVISIDMPSGLFSDGTTLPAKAIRSAYTLSFQCYKPALLLAENAPFFGVVSILNIGLLPQFISGITPVHEVIDHEMATSITRPRPLFAHKGNFGHALLLAGSLGKVGAAVMAAEACLRSGAGLLTCGIPMVGMNILQTSVPEAMAIPIGEDIISESPDDLDRFRAIGCGPGIGTDPATAAALAIVLKNFKQPMVWDADALNLLAQQPQWWEELPPLSILTPHPKEFERLAGNCSNELDRLEKARRLAMEKKVIVVLKGHRTFVAMPGGRTYFNLSGNASMAKGGSGDVLTGILTGLMARDYVPDQAAVLGVYLHGLAGELASADHGMESVLARDIIAYIGPAFVALA
ncbi:NAD(P)H-hydrate dehydratase [Flavihumibacter rivuli]|uniref:NAD(P)H-hydrate dehydratase n=1 Tax=Flavihumibacter rivuli TaxID=2838156 RepID=UPI001BDF6345|nr:NAD(P)H-hydrate dehydratase [Flavihumibacter rivuli]ULQ57613.1 NAD(P)H-hydrate dehydratase [Flavihumibacter rivuli]